MLPSSSRAPAGARRSRVVPRSKQLGGQTRRCRAEQAAGQGSNKPTSHERDLDVSINLMAISFHGYFAMAGMWMRLVSRLAGELRSAEQSVGLVCGPGNGVGQLKGRSKGWA
jgi:hypothetical protein